MPACVRWMVGSIGPVWTVYDLVVLLLQKMWFCFSSSSFSSAVAAPAATAITFYNVIFVMFNSFSLCFFLCSSHDQRHHFFKFRFLLFSFFSFFFSFFLAFFLSFVSIFLSLSFFLMCNSGSYYFSFFPLSSFLSLFVILSFFPSSCLVLLPDTNGE